MHAREILEACVYADDLEAAERFYSAVLGMEVITRVEDRHVFFRCGGRVFLVFNPAATADGGVVPGHGATGPGHVCFAMGADEMDAWRAHLRTHGVEVEMEREWPGGGRSIYLRDPAGNSVELGTPSIWRIPDAAAFGAGAE
ncbi:VOC family protein [Longimicrobium sp.]|uniref:VOC family protein n=1 Tax=Longimicrobium sp. TaxID=2029185 RepID=UPI002E2F43A5|nr:VOC family protein [Longimicrobium sp.]HEX6038628.1 VOC family protein [Longimicrobium sp.]